jgi:hypothetical protein
MAYQRVWIYIYVLYHLIWFCCNHHIPCSVINKAIQKTIDMAWLYCSPIPVGRRVVQMISTCFAAHRGSGGGGGGVSTLWRRIAV